MTVKRKIQIIVDIAMTALLPLLMAYSLVGETFHEWAGVAMFMLFLLHHGLNWRWHKNLFHGRYSTIRVIGTAINTLIFLLMLALTVSGIVMSRYAFRFLSIESGTSLARIVHLAASYWCYVLTSIHLGLHGSMLVGMLQKIFQIKRASGMRKIVIRAVDALLAVYGIYAFTRRSFGEYMLLKIKFVFFDYSEPLVFFILDYLAIMALFFYSRTLYGEVDWKEE